MRQIHSFAQFLSLFLHFFSSCDVNVRPVFARIVVCFLLKIKGSSAKAKQRWFEARSDAIAATERIRASARASAFARHRQALAARAAVIAGRHVAAQGSASQADTVSKAFNSADTNNPDAVSSQLTPAALILLQHDVEKLTIDVSQATAQAAAAVKTATRAAHEAAHAASAAEGFVCNDAEVLAPKVINVLLRMLFFRPPGKHEQQARWR